MATNQLHQYLICLLDTEKDGEQRGIWSFNSFFDLDEVANMTKSMYKGFLRDRFGINVVLLEKCSKGAKPDVISQVLVKVRDKIINILDTEAMLKDNDNPPPPPSFNHMDPEEWYHLFNGA